jgi:predicted Zn-dependent protease with MMP-like domain
MIDIEKIDKIAKDSGAKLDGYYQSIDDNSRLKYKFTPDQLQAYTNAIIELCAKEADFISNAGFGSLVDSGQNGAFVTAKAIRNLKVK